MLGSSAATWKLRGYSPAAHATAYAAGQAATKQMHFEAGRLVLVLGPPAMAGKKGTIVGPATDNAYAVRFDSGSVYYIATENLKYPETDAAGAKAPAPAVGGSGDALAVGGRGDGLSYGLIVPAVGSFPSVVYEACKREQNSLKESLGGATLVFEKELQELPRVSMLAGLLAKAYDVDVIICVHPMESTPLHDSAEGKALGRQFFRVRESLKATARTVSVPMLMHPAICDANFLNAMKGSSFFKDVTKATVDDALLLAEAHRMAKA